MSATATAAPAAAAAPAETLSRGQRFKAWTGGAFKKAGVAALIGGGLVALPFIVSGLRGGGYKARDLPHDPVVDLPPPEVYTPSYLNVVNEGPPGGGGGMPSYLQNNPTGNTPPVLDGPVLKTVLARRNGLGNGVDPTSPDIMGLNGGNVIDGSGEIASLNSPVPGR